MSIGQPSIVKMQTKIPVTFSIESKRDSEISVITSIRIAKLSSKFFYENHDDVKDQLMMKRETTKGVPAQTAAIKRANSYKGNKLLQTLTKETPPTAILVSLCRIEKNKIIK